MMRGLTNEIFTEQSELVNGRMSEYSWVMILALLGQDRFTVVND